MYVPENKWVLHVTYIVYLFNNKLHILQTFVGNLGFKEWDWGGDYGV